MKIVEHASLIRADRDLRTALRLAREVPTKLIPLIGDALTGKTLLARRAVPAEAEAAGLLAPRRFEAGRTTRDLAQAMLYNLTERWPGTTVPMTDTARRIGAELTRAKVSTVTIDTFDKHAPTSIAATCELLLGVQTIAQIPIVCIARSNFTHTLFKASGSHWHAPVALAPLEGSPEDLGDGASFLSTVAGCLHGCGDVLYKPEIATAVLEAGGWRAGDVLTIVALAIELHERQAIRLSRLTPARIREAIVTFQMRQPPAPISTARRKVA
ncbi:MAG: hypothetical protein K2P80_14505 [Beijerinckiaceae bacterium]|nr:hypothetical protein [Beijerinckiaceae bacterium]